MVRLRLPLLLCLLAALARAQQGGGGYGGGGGFGSQGDGAASDYDPNNPYGPGTPGGGGKPGFDDGGMNQGGDEDESATTSESKGGAPGPMSLEDAKINFGTVVRTYLANNSPDDYWPVRAEGRALRLLLDSVDDHSVSQVTANIFKGRASFRDIYGKTKVDVDFTVDFSGSRWRVDRVGAPRVRRGPAAAGGAKRGGRPDASPKPPSSASYAAALKRHIRGIAKRRGAFRVKDGTLNKTWTLELVKVAGRLEDLGGGRWFACADFKEVGGLARLDLDFYASPRGRGWKFEQVLIHQVDGAPRYRYDEKHARVPPL